MATRADLEKYLRNPNVRKMLELISYTEATQTHGAATAFGGGRLSSLDDHPRYRKRFRQNDGSENLSSAAGKYQFLERTWDGLVRDYGFEDFGEHNQDLAAVALLIGRGALQPLLDGDFETAVRRAGPEWASLPTAPASYKQSKKSWDKVNKFLEDYTGPIGPSVAESDASTPTPSVPIVSPSTMELLPINDKSIPPEVEDMFDIASASSYGGREEETPILTVDGKPVVPENEYESNMFSDIADLGLSAEKESATAKAASLVAKAKQGVLDKPLIQNNPLIPSLSELFDMV